MNLALRPQPSFTQASDLCDLYRLTHAPAPSDEKDLVASITQKINTQDFPAAVETIIGAINDNQLSYNTWSKIVNIMLPLLEPESPILPADLKKKLFFGVYRHLDPQHYESLLSTLSPYLT